MKFLVIGEARGNIDIINQYVEKTNVDAVLCCGGVGINYRSNNIPPHLIKNDFCDYLEGKKKFIVPVISIRGTYDNLSLWGLLCSKKLCVDNLILIDNGEVTAARDNEKNKNIIIGGMGGTYSPIYYKKEKLFGNTNRHFTEFQINKLMERLTHILLMNDLIGEYNSKRMMFSDETFKLFDMTNAFYCFVGRYHWWAHSNVATHVISLPYANKGYCILNTNDWNTEGITLDVSIK